MNSHENNIEKAVEDILQKLDKALEYIIQKQHNTYNT